MPRRNEEAEAKPGADPLACALGVVGIGLGVAELAAPRQVARLVGVPADASNLQTLRAMGVREIGSGLGILTSRRPADWLWGRVAGDALDLSLLAGAAAQRGAQPKRLAGAAAAVLAIGALDVLCANRLSARAPAPVSGAAPIHVVKSIAVGRPPEELYAFWRDLENLPSVMRHLREVRRLDERRSHWKARAPLGLSVGWDAEIVEERRGERLAWRSLPGSQVETRGSVAFQAAPGGRGAIVTVELVYAPPAGAAGVAVAKLFGEAPDRQLHEDLRRFKQTMELGEAVRSDGAQGRAARPASTKRRSAR